MQILIVQIGNGEIFTLHLCSGSINQLYGRRIITDRIQRNHRIFYVITHNYISINV